MRNRKIFATFLITATCLAVFAGCGKKDETEKGEAAGSKTTEATAGEKEDKISNTLEVDNGDAIQWRADSQDSWNDLVKLTELKGADGQDGTNGKNGVNGTNSKNVEIRKEASYIQWRYAGGSWKNLVALSSLAWYPRVSKWGECRAANDGLRDSVALSGRRVEETGGVS